MEGVDMWGLRVYHCCLMHYSSDNGQLINAGSSINLTNPDKNNDDTENETGQVEVFTVEDVVCEQHELFEKQDDQNDDRRGVCNSSSTKNKCLKIARLDTTKPNYKWKIVSG